MRIAGTLLAVSLLVVGSSWAQAAGSEPGAPPRAGRARRGCRGSPSGRALGSGRGREGHVGPGDALGGHSGKPGFGPGPRAAGH